MNVPPVTKKQSNNNLFCGAGFAQGMYVSDGGNLPSFASNGFQVPPAPALKVEEKDGTKFEITGKGIFAQQTAVLILLSVMVKKGLCTIEEIEDMFIKVAQYCKRKQIYKDEVGKYVADETLDNVIFQKLLGLSADIINVVQGL